MQLSNSLAQRAAIIVVAGVLVAAALTVGPLGAVGAQEDGGVTPTPSGGEDDPYDCGDFNTTEGLLEVYGTGDEDPSNLDGDDDGLPCEEDFPVLAPSESEDVPLTINYTVNPTTISPGESFRVNATVRNTGDEVQESVVITLVNGTIFATSIGDIAPGETKNISTPVDYGIFEPRTNIEERGSGTVTVNNLEPTTITLEENQTTTEEPSSPTVTSPTMTTTTATDTDTDTDTTTSAPTDTATTEDTTTETTTSEDGGTDGDGADGKAKDTATPSDGADGKAKQPSDGADGGNGKAKLS